MSEEKDMNSSKELTEDELWNVTGGVDPKTFLYQGYAIRQDVPLLSAPYEGAETLYIVPFHSKIGVLEEMCGNSYVDCWIRGDRKAVRGFYPLIYIGKDI